MLYLSIKIRKNGEDEEEEEERRQKIMNIIVSPTHFRGSSLLASNEDKTAPLFIFKIIVGIVIALVASRWYHRPDDETSKFSRCRRPRRWRNNSSIAARLLLFPSPHSALKTTRCRSRRRRGRSRTLRLPPTRPFPFRDRLSPSCRLLRRLTSPGVSFRYIHYFYARYSSCSRHLTNPRIISVDRVHF